MVHGPGPAAIDRVDEGHGLLDRDRRQVDAVGHVPHRIDVGLAGAGVVVDHHRSLGIGLDPGRIQPQVLGIGIAPGRRQQQIALEPRAIGETYLQSPFRSSRHARSSFRR